MSIDIKTTVGSGPQILALLAVARTDMLWLSRLAAVNVCLFIVGTVQVSRILMWQTQQQGSFIGALKALGQDVKGAAKKTDAEVVAEAKKAKAEL